MKTGPIRRLAQTDDVCGEGAVFHPTHNAMYWTDINRGLIHRYHLETTAVDTWTPVSDGKAQPVTALTLTTDPEQLLVVLGGEIILWRPANNRTTRTLYKLPTYPASRCNDARVDPTGTLWIGTMQNNVAPDGSTKEVTENLGKLLSLSPAGELKIWQKDIGISNTFAWSPDTRTMYFADTLANTIWQYDFAASTISNQRIFNHGFARGLPDGSTMDSEGYLWNCRYGGSAIIRFAPNGDVDRIIEVPVPNPTTCTFGGPNLTTLYFTSAGNGGLYSIETDVEGLPSTPYNLTDN